MNFSRLDEWLAHLERLHPQIIAMGLERVQAVKAAAGLDPGFPIVIVGGTNGKGSTCAMLEAAWLAAGFRVGCYTSPHLIRYNERVRIDGRMLDDAQLCAGFAAVEAARGSVALTYFEFGTLAAMWSFAQAGIDVAILEVGLGGRLDAVNAFEPELAIVTTVDLDHQEYLGDTREQIGWEKAGIFRAGRPAICADAAPPESLVQHAAEIGAILLRREQDFGARPGQESWTYWGPSGTRPGLPYPIMRGAQQLANAAAVVAALEGLRARLPVTQAAVRSALLSARLPGRFQVLPGKPLLVLDVAHNAQAARALAENLRALPTAGKTIAVFGMLRDKDVAAVIEAMHGVVDAWCVGSLGGPRGSDAADVARCLVEQGEQVLLHAADIAQAYAGACRAAGEDDRICAFGSFHTVADVLIARGAKSQ